MVAIYSTRTNAAEQQNFRKWSECSCYKTKKVVLGSLSRSATLGRRCALHTACGIRSREDA